MCSWPCKAVLTLVRWNIFGGISEAINLKVTESLREYFEVALGGE